MVDEVYALGKSVGRGSLMADNATLKVIYIGRPKGSDEVLMYMVCSNPKGGSHIVEGHFVAIAFHEIDVTCLDRVCARL